MKEPNNHLLASSLILIVYVGIEFINTFIYNFLQAGFYYYTVIGVFIAGAISCILIQKNLNFYYDFEAPYPNQIRNSIQYFLLGLLGCVVLLLSMQFLPSSFPLDFLSQHSFQATNEIIHRYPIFVIVPTFFQPLIEEFVFRKVVTGLMVHPLGWFRASLISSIFFMLGHLDKPIIIYALLGLILAFTYSKTKNIWAPFLIHLAWNSIIIFTMAMVR